MLDIGFFEVVLVFVVALLVLGPKRLPEVARTVGRILGKGQKLWRKVKEEISDLDSDNQKHNERDSHE